MSQTKLNSREELRQSLLQYKYGVGVLNLDDVMAIIDQHLTNQLEELKSELRDYRDEYPDADISDAIGYITGVQARSKPQPTTDKEEKI
jgi:hypothetical protein